MRLAPLLAAAAVILPIAAAPAQPAKKQAGAPKADAAIASAVAAPSRTPKNVARDAYRHPAQTLAFFGVTPSQTVVEYAPSGGWYSEILAPLLRGKGTFYALQPTGRGLDGYKTFLAAKPTVYDKVKVVAYPEEASAIPKGSVDTVLTFRNVHNMVMAGSEAATFKAFFDMLKPGGTLGVVDHRLPENRDTALEKSSGYLKVSTIRRIAQAAGFEYVGASEVNANPKDTADWPKGVWTLPPTLSQKDVDKDKYLAIGESDRMTLKFRKPVK
ncbi:methyltransferase [Sphingobium sp. CR2-8]|uniref:class I SAM-dependent methyltransferase n=1 Tax=Sphingobium sp. CR2-8 TaxID=1306534 RepID=UPI002DB83224|nr:methyltransferase [Sphingobium sp. CR2-8]MEC3910609.1 methyltransferase [Sphingobium sp. CR2-8]